MPSKIRSAACVGVAATIAAMGAVTAAPVHAMLAPSGGTISQITISPQGETEANGNGRYGAVASNDGRYVAFWSYSPSIVADDANGLSDVFLYDATTGVTKLISRTDAGAPGNSGSSQAEISANGKFVVFNSSATDLAGGSPAGFGDLVYRYTVASGKVKLVSKSPQGELPTNAAVATAISANGRYIVYGTIAHNIVPGDHNQLNDVFRYDAVLDETIMVSQTLGGLPTDKYSYGGPISGNGRFVAYASKAENMGAADTNNDIDTYVYDVQTDTTSLVSHDPAGIAVGGTPTGISDNGKIVSFSSESDALDPKDTDEFSGAFVYNASNNVVKLVSLPSAEWPDGVIAFSSGVSANGRYISYDALPQDDARGSDVYLYDRQTKQTAKISVTPAGADADSGSGASSLSRSGNYIGFTSAATTLVPGDTRGGGDIFLWRRTAP